MFLRPQLEEYANRFSTELLKGLAPGHEVHLLEDDRILTGFRSQNMSNRRPIQVPIIRGVVVGIDVREWTRRDQLGQFIVAAILNSCILQTIDLIRARGMYEPDEPMLIVPTGDGAYVVFCTRDSLEVLKEAEDKGRNPAEERLASERDKRAEASHVETIAKALSFVLTLNTLLTEYNARKVIVEHREENADGMGVLPIYPRFAVVLEQLLLALDANERLNMIGPAMVTCGRILSTDHGNHFLVNERLLHTCDPYGGLGAVTSRAGLGDWQAHFHSTELPDALVKQGRFRYADVFGHYSDAPLLRLHGMASVRPREYHIGSHDVLRVQSSWQAE